MIRRRLARGEDGHTPSLQRSDRTQAKVRLEDLDLLQRTDRPDVAPTNEHDEIRDEHAVGVEVPKWIMSTAADEDPRIDLNRWNCRTAAVEDDDVGFALRGERSALQDVRHRHRTRQTPARAAATDCDDAGQRSGLEIVGRRVVSRTREIEERCERGLHGGDLRLCRPASSHCHDDHVAVPCEEARNMSGDGGLPHALAGSDHRERRQRKRRIDRRRELEVCAFVT